MGAAAIALGALGLFVAENATVHAPIDDAYIFYRYAQHIADGDGLVYNLGERVEGFTSPLWTLLLAAGITAGADAVTIGHWLGVGSGMLLLWLTFEYTAFGLTGGARIVAALSSWLLCLSMPFAVWSTSGLETPLFAAAGVAALIAGQRRRPWLSMLASAIAFLVRPEGLVLGGVLFLCLLDKTRFNRRSVVRPLTGYVLFVLLLTGLRLLYFGDPLPNTFYAKVGEAIPWWGVAYALAFLIQTLLPLLWPIGYVWSDREFAPGRWFSCCVLLSVLTVGGDTFSFSRYFVPALPVLCALSVRGAIRAHERTSAAARFAMLSIPVCGVWYAFGTLAGIVALVAAVLGSVSVRAGWKQRAIVVGVSLLLLSGGVFLTRRGAPRTLDQNTALDFDLIVEQIALSTRYVELRKVRTSWSFMAAMGQRFAERVDARPPADKLVAALGIGSFGYYSSARVLDLAGLIDPTIAKSGPAREGRDMALPGHQRSNPSYVLSRRPDYVLIPPPFSGFLRVPALVELWTNPEFCSTYEWDSELEGFRRGQRQAGPTLVAD